VGLVLARFADRIGRVFVRFSPPDGERNGSHKCCEIQVGLQPVRLHVEDVDRDVFAAVNRATDRASRSSVTRSSFFAFDTCSNALAEPQILESVIGCSEQLPNEIRAYHLMGTSTDGTVLLSRHGATYSAATGEVSAYAAVLERMPGVVLKSLPPLRERARVCLVRRWNRDWGVEAEDLAQLGVSSANDNGSAFATEAENRDSAVRALATHDHQ
jgi:hypothetical protein